MPYVSKPMKPVTVWLTEEETAFLDELAKKENVTLSKALREGAQLYFNDAHDWIATRRGDTGTSSPRSPEQLVSVEEVAKLLDVSTDWVYDRAAAGELPHYRLGRPFLHEPGGRPTSRV